MNSYTVFGTVENNRNIVLLAKTVAFTINKLFTLITKFHN